MVLSAIITSSVKASTLSDIDEWIDELVNNYGLSLGTELLEGAQLHLAGSESLLKGLGYPNKVKTITLGDLAVWLGRLYAKGATPDTPVLDAEDLAIDLPSAEISVISCGNCEAEYELLGVIVDTHVHESVFSDAMSELH